MDEKTLDKRLNKLIRKSGLKGIFKKVDNFEECDIVLFMFDDKPGHDLFITKKDFKEKILPRPVVGDFVLRYLKHTNPRYNNNLLLSKRIIDKGYRK